MDEFVSKLQFVKYRINIFNDIHSLPISVPLFRPQFSADRNQNQNALPGGVQKRPAVPYLSQHDELVRFMHESWHKVSRIFDDIFFNT